MKIPKYWGRGSAEGMDQRGKPVKFSVWGFSETSDDDARQKARARAQDILSRFVSGERLNSYSYGERPMREEIVEAVSASRHKEVALVTRNAYGALVLNAANAMFMDLDFPPMGGGLLAGLFGSRSKKEAAREEARLRQVERWSDSRRDLGLRVYRTRAGLRCLVTNETFDPAAKSTEEMMKELECDPLYIKLCRRQECFRARLTPKPWRIRLEKPPARYPFTSSRERDDFRRWEKEYQQASTSFAVCRLVKELGSARVHPEIAPVLALHDKLCLAGSELALA
jgi:hypothetical protein